MANETSLNGYEYGINPQTTAPFWRQEGGGSSDTYTKEEIDAKLAEKADADEVYEKTETYSKTEANALLNDKADTSSVHNIPTGGTAGQVLKKSSSANYDVEWANESGGGSVDAYTKAQTDTLLDAKADKATTYTKTETDTLLSGKADASTTYTKTETDTLLSGKADATTTYTKTETDTLLNSKADASTTYTKTETDTLLNGKADSATTYTKTETDTLLGAKANSSSVHNVPTGGNINQVLKKASNADYDMVWADESGGGGGTSDKNENLIMLEGGSVTNNGVTFNFNATAGTITLSGTYSGASGGTSSSFSGKIKFKTSAIGGNIADYLIGKTVIFSATPSRAVSNDAKYYMTISGNYVSGLGSINPFTLSSNDTLENRTLTIPDSAQSVNISEYNISISYGSQQTIYSGQEVLYPMLSYADSGINTFAPCEFTNNDLYQMVNSLKTSKLDVTKTQYLGTNLIFPEVDTSGPQYTQMTVGTKYKVEISVWGAVQNTAFEVPYSAFVSGDYSQQGTPHIANLAKYQTATILLGNSTVGYHTAQCALIGNNGSMPIFAMVGVWDSDFYLSNTKVKVIAP